MAIGDAIRIQRTRLRMTQNELAQKLGVSQSLVGQWERGHQKNPRIDTVAKLAGALDMCTADFVALSEAADRMKDNPPVTIEFVLERRS